jgi:NhaP-type Na+/H+ or K+/H+ antiporter
MAEDQGPLPAFTLGKGANLAEIKEIKQQHEEMEQKAREADAKVEEQATEKPVDPLAKVLSKFMDEAGAQTFLESKEGQRFKSMSVNVILVALLFSVVYCMLKPKCKAGEECVHPGLPGGTVFDLLEVLICGILGGKLIANVGLPPLFGQLLMGFLLKNVIPDQLNGLSAGLNSMLRSVALAIIMLRAGLGLDFSMLRKSSVSTMVLATGPCIGEATTIAVLANIIFPGMSWPFCFMLGFCIADVSPAVTTPILLDLNIQKRGTKKGVPTILLAAGSVNSVMAIVFYKIVEEFAWQGAISPENVVSIVGMKFFVQVFGIGGACGWLMGKFTRMCWYLTEDKTARFAILFLMAMLTLFGFKQVGMSGGGTLAVLMMGTTIHNSLSEEEIDMVEKPVAGILGQAWSNCGAVLLFTLLGASLDASKLSPELVGMGVMLVVLGLVGRSIALFFTLFLFPQWGVKEKLFSMVSWCPKATVQAALATAALDYITVQIKSGKFIENDPEVVQFLDNAMVILTTAILSIIMTAPLFAVLMLQLAPRLLDDDKEEEECSTSV